MSERRLAIIYKGRRLQFFFVLIFFSCLIAFGQANQPGDDKEEKLKEEILVVYKTGGEEGLRNFIKKQTDKISKEFIVSFADAALKERNEEWLIITEIIADKKNDEKIRADVLYRKGEYFRSISDNEKATDYFNKALRIYIKLNDMVGQGNMYYRKGNIYRITGYNLKALDMYDKALIYFKKARHYIGQGSVYYNRGLVYFYTGNNSKAFGMYDKALPLFEKANYFIGQGNVYKSKGDIYLNTGDNSRAIKMYDKALPFFEKAEDPIGQGNVYLKKGMIYFKNGVHLKAIDMYDKALTFYEKSGQIIGQGNVYHNKGEIYFYIGDNSRSLDMYDKALLFFEKARFPIGQGNVYNSKGDIYIRIGDNSSAFDMYEKALLFYERAKEPRGQGTVYRKKGDIYLTVGDTSKAIELYDKALPFFEKAGQPIGQGNVYWRKGDTFLTIGNTSKALEMYDKALPFFEKAGDSIGQGNIYRRKGDIYLKIGDNLNALVMYDKALHFFETAKTPLSQGIVYTRKGDISLKIGENSKALNLYDKALTFLEKVGDIEIESDAFQGKAKVLAKLGKTNEALDLFEKAIANLEKVRTQTAFSEMKKTFMEKVYDQYEETVMFMLENQYYDKGLKYAEAMRSRVFLDRMAEGLVRIEKGITPDLKPKQDNLVSKLSLLSKEINEKAGKQDEKKLKELKEQYRKVEEELEELLVKIRLNNPLYASVRYPEPVTVKDLQKDVLKERDLLLRYFIAKDKIYVFLISQENFNVVTLEANEKNIKDLAEQYLLAMEARSSRGIRKLGGELYRKLFKPLEASIKDGSDIIIVPDGELAKIPFETFIVDDTTSGKPVYLLEKYRVKYIQSASALAILRKYYTREGQSRRFIGFGDPVYDYENFKQGKPEIGTVFRSPVKIDAISEILRSRYNREGGKLTRLKNSGEEVNTIANLFKNQSQKCLVHLRQQANETNAKSPDLKEFDYIHFACHAVMGDGFQSLVLSQLPESESTEDGYLTLNEIMNCDYNAKLVVLSACRTGKGKMERSEGVTGLTRAVMYAGTPAVMASLWDVEDIATKELMVKFYRNMLEKNLDKTEALRQAKLELLKNKKYASPLFWSAFVLYGE